MIACEPKSFFRWIGRYCGCIIALLCPAISLQAAYISEIDLDGPAGQAIELSQVDSATNYTVLFINATPTSNASFGTVIDVLHLPANTGLPKVTMVTDTAWPGDPLLTTELSSLGLASADASLPLFDHLLLVVMEARSNVTRGMNPLTQPGADTAYNENTVTDWLVLSSDDPSAAYAAKENLGTINAELGINLLARVVKTDAAGSIIARSNEPGQDIDKDVFYTGEPDPISRQFDVGDEWVYTYTPGMSNLPLAAQLPEPSSLAILVLTLGLVYRRPRGRVDIASA